MKWEDISKAINFLLTGQFCRVWNEVHVRFYRAVWELLFAFILPFRCAGRSRNNAPMACSTAHPVAFESPDHLAPKGTAENNSTNKKFVLHMDAKLSREFGRENLRFMDLGCSGGQLVADFMKLQWSSVGLEGSDFSLKQRRANWARLAGTHLFTCDITKPYQVEQGGCPARFHLITAWEVMEHIATSDIGSVFNNIVKHLEVGGYFIASTTETTDIHNGLELHQTRWTNATWCAYVHDHFSELEPVDVGLKIYQYVRYNFRHPSFLVYRKRNAVLK
ncbi:MAG: class I SAM-dependent methyltransferase [Verrucomicrobia bacterium]|nr:MAG: class I SAM-dependent methyltransferase [Verrucomicrobiota bacterium]